MPSSIAPLVAAWRRRARNLPAPARGSGEASNGQPVMVELLVAGVWVDITSYTMVRDDSGQISITYGIQGGEGSQTDRAQAQLQLKNQDGRFTPRNPAGPYYGLIGRNTQLRISVPDGNGGKDYQIWGEVTSWAPNWDSTGTDVWVDVTVNGILQRLAQAPNPERSVIYRAVTSPGLTGLVAYWALEDPTGSTVFASALLNGSPATWTGAPVLAAFEGFAASDPLPTLTGASVTGGVTKYDTSTVTRYQMRFLLAVPKTGFSDSDVISRLQVAEVAAGVSLLNYFDIQFNDPPGGLGSFGNPGTLTLLTRDGDEADIGSSASITMDVRGRLLRVSLENSITSTTMTSTLRVMDINTGLTDSASNTISSTSMSRVLSMTLAPATLGGSAGLSSGAAGHLLLQTAITDIGDLGRAIQPLGEAAGRRIQRLCGEEGIAFGWVGDLDDTVALGAQGKSNLLALAQESTLADGGLLYETTNVLGLGYRTRASLYTQDPAIVLDYTGYNLAAVPVPVEDDRYVQNRVTVTVAGVSQTYEATTGALSTAAVGVYGDNSGVTLNLASTDDNTLLDQAAWRVHLGTVDEARYPQVSVNLAHPSVTPAMRRAILALRLGDRLQITNPPAAWLPPDTIDQLILGTSATITHFEHRITFVCAPASPFTVGYLDSADARIDIDSQLLTAIGTSDTSIDVTPAPGETDLWTTDSAEVPWDIRMGGEVMRVTAVTPKALDTFTRVTASGWGTADTGQAWTTTGGSASDYSTSGTQGLHSLGSVNTSRYSVATSLVDADLRAEVQTAALATGGPQYAHVVARYLDVNNAYAARLSCNIDQTITLTIQKRVGGAQTDITSTTMPFTHAAATPYAIRFQIAGSTLRAKAWPLTDVEVPIWYLSTVDTALPAAGAVGVRSVLDAANTNALPLVVTYDNVQVTNPQTMTVTRSINGVVKSHPAGDLLSLAHPIPLAL